MTRIGRGLGIAASLALVSGCVPATKAPPVAAPPAPSTGAAPGLDGVIGRSAAALSGRFGAPSLDVREGPARKLQFANAVCVLDIYLYPGAGGGEAVATHVDARLPDGRDIDRASCIASLGR